MVISTRVTRLLQQPKVQRLLGLTNRAVGRTVYDLAVLGSTPKALTALKTLAGERYDYSLSDQFSRWPGSTGVFYRRLVLSPKGYRISEPSKAYICLPTKNSATKIREYLQGLKTDLALANGVAFELMICVNNSDDGTEARILEELLTWEPQHQITLLISRDHTGKSRAVNLLKDEAARSFQQDALQQPSLKPYLVFTDDDIRIECTVPGCSGVARLLETLEQKELAAVSGNYFVRTIDLRLTEPFKSFWRYINGVRRRVSLPIPQLYGGGWACRLADFPEAGLPHSLIADDCYLSLHFFHQGRLLSDPTVLLSIPLPETALDSCGRWLRDSGAWEQLKEYVISRGLFTAEQVGDFHEARKKAFSAVTDLMEAYPLGHPVRSANWLNWQIRLGLMWLQNKGYVPEGFKPASLRFFRMNHREDLWEMLGIKELKRTPFTVYQYLLAAADDLSQQVLAAPGISASGKNSLREPGLAAYDKLKRIEWLLDGADASKLRQLSVNNQALQDLISLADYLKMIRGLLVQPEFMRGIFAQMGITLTGQIDVKVVNPGMIGFGFLVGSDNGSYFLKYTDVLGKVFPPIFEERRENYHQILGDILTAELVGEDYAIRPIFPALDQARVALTAEEFGTQKILHRAVVKEDISGRYIPYDEEIASRVEDYTASQQAQQRLVKYATALGRLHARSIPLRKQFLAGQKGGLVDYLYDIQEEMVGVDPAAHAHWLKDSNYMFAKIRRYFLGDPVYQGVLPAQRKALADRWAWLVGRSAKALSEYGAIGHFDYNPNDIFVGVGNESLKIFDFKRVGFTDPALEAATGLSRRLRGEWRRPGFDPTKIVQQSQRIIADYLEAYLKPVKLQLGEKKNREIADRIKEFCGFLVLNLIATEPPRFTDQQRAKQEMIILARQLLRI